MTIFEEPLFIRLLSQSPLSRREFSVLLSTAPNRYKEHYIEKRNGRGKRLISQPTAELKFFQKLLVDNELNNLPVHESASAYRNGLSIRNHALPHANSKYLLKLDFENFFPSLTEESIRHLLKSQTTYSEIEKWIICQLLCRRRPGERGLHLSIGSPSSPLVSNLLMYEFDCIAADYCLSKNVIYTRYADDIALSTSVPGLLNEVYAFFDELIRNMPQLGLSLNASKTINVSRKHQRKLTGLVLSNTGSASIGRNRKRILRAALHALSIHKEPEMPASRLRGMLAFVYSVDPTWVKNLCRRYGFRSISDIEATDHNKDEEVTRER